MAIGESNVLVRAGLLFLSLAFIAVFFWSIESVRVAIEFVTPARSQASNAIMDGPLNLLPALKPAEVLSGLRLTLSSPKIDYEQGDHIELTETFTNVSDHVIYENFRSVWRDQYEMAVYCPSDQCFGIEKSKKKEPYLVIDAKPSPILPDSSSDFESNMFSSKHFSTNLEPHSNRISTQHFKLMDPGIYRFKTTWSSNYSADHQDDLWQGELISNELYIHVHPNTEFFEKASKLEFAFSSDRLNFKAGEPIRIIGRLKNVGTSTVVIDRYLSRVGVNWFEMGAFSISPGLSSQVIAQRDPVALADGETIELVGFENAPSDMKGNVKMSARCCVEMQVGPNYFSRTIDSTNSIEIQVE